MYQNGLKYSYFATICDLPLVKTLYMYLYYKLADVLFCMCLVCWIFKM
jgi:hypothetical protein